MTTTLVDIRNGISEGVALKLACRVATTANITLSGLQTVDGVALAADDRVLVKNQTDATENGVYVAAATAWERAPDFDGNRDVVTYTRVLVVAGTVGTGEYYVSTTDDIDFGETEITFTAITAASAVADDSITDAKLRESGALSVIGRSANSTGNPADISATASSGAALRESGGVLGFGTIATAGIADDAVTYPKIQDVTAPNRVLGRITSGSGVVEELTAANVRTIINVEDGADVTDATNVDAAGAVMNSDTSTASMSFVIDEDNMASDSATKVPTQQSVKAYVDAAVIAGGGYTDENAQDAVGGMLVDTATIDFTYDDATPQITADVIDGSITYAKFQDVSATSRILGRITSGSGDVEELTGANVRTIINVEDGADVTDATNVDAAGAVMESDASTASMSFVIDEDDMTSNSATKVPTQQSVKAYVDGEISGVGGSSLTREARTSNTILGTADSSKLIEITSGTFSQTFTAAATLGDGWFVYIYNSGTGDITLEPNSSEQIDGLTNFIMYPGESRLVTCDGSALHSVVLKSFSRTWTATAASGFTKPPGYIFFQGLLWGSGGAGGTNASNSGGGGAGGSCVPINLPASAVGSTENVTIGAAVAGRSTSGEGDDGNNSSFGSLVTAYGGAGGGFSTGGGGAGVQAAATSQAGAAPLGGAAASPGGTSTFGGGGGGNSGGAGGASVYGGAGGGGNTNGNGGASVYGGGGGGGNTAGTGGASVFGGAGGAGGNAGGTNGTAPGGGGGGCSTGTSGAGARGELRLWGVV